MASNEPGDDSQSYNPAAEDQDRYLLLLQAALAVDSDFASAVDLDRALTVLRLVFASDSPETLLKSWIDYAFHL